MSRLAPRTGEAKTPLAPTLFVTGGAGYVGAHCCKAFAKAGWTVVVYDNLSRGWRDFVKWGELIEGDILDEAALAAALARVKPDAVAHFAALAYVGESVADPAAYYRTNVVGTLNLLTAMRAAGVDKLIFSSSCATYGDPIYTPIDEAHPQAPVSPYGWSKLMAERLLIDHDAAYGLRSVILRYFNAAGADPDGEVGERHEPETHLIPLAIRAALPGDYQLSIFGDDFDTRDGTCVRDYVHVADLADAHLRAAKHLFDGGHSNAFNLGSDTGATVYEAVAAVEKCAQGPVRRRVGERRAGDATALYATSEKAVRVVGWRAEHSHLDDIVRHALRWHLATGSAPPKEPV